MVEINGACITNDGNPTLLTLLGSNKSIIDIIITSIDLAPLCEITTESDIFGSNHYPQHNHWRLLLSFYKYKLILNTDKANKLHHYLLSTSEEFFNNPYGFY